jgi:hypothetical protein
MRAHADEEEPRLFEDLSPPQPDCRHVWTKGEQIWPGEEHVRLIWVCNKCGAVRGRA